MKNKIRIPWIHSKGFWYIFIERGEEIVSTKGKIKEWEKVYKATQKAVDTQTPLVVLINQTSASASEIVSGVVQDLDRGVVIGNRSFGKGLVQQSRKLSYNTQLKVTIAKYYTPSGRCIQALDYSNRNEDGSVGKIADTLKTAFKTKNGRTVYDGGGIEPDIEVEKSPISNIAISLIQKRLIFDYATDYRHSNEKITAVEDYQFSDFEDFKLFLSDKEYEYSTETEDVIKELKEIAEEELYYESISPEYDALITKLTANKKDDLNKFKSEIIELLTGEIASRYYYQKGRIIANLQFDEDVQEAIKILSNQEQYNSILSGALD